MHKNRNLSIESLDRREMFAANVLGLEQDVIEYRVMNEPLTKAEFRVVANKLAADNTDFFIEDFFLFGTQVGSEG